MSETTSVAAPRPVKDFSQARPPIRFTIDGDTFEAASDIPAEVLVQFANRFNDLNLKTLDPEAQYRTLMSVMELVLFPASFASLTGRTKDLERPVTLPQLSDVIAWLLGEYGMRPTQPSSNSSAGPGNPVPGTSLTASTPGEVSTSVPLHLTVS